MNDKEEFWDSLRMPPAEERCCHNCKHKEQVYVVDYSRGTRRPYGNMVHCSLGHDDKSTVMMGIGGQRIWGNCYEHTMFGHDPNYWEHPDDMPHLWEWDGNNE